MAWYHGVLHKLRTLARESEYERGVAEEFAHHGELDRRNAGGEPSPRRFGNSTYYKEEARRMTWLASLDVLRQDVRYAWRSLARSPGFTATVIVTLALGLGVNGALFSVLDRMFVRPPAGVQSPSDLRRVWMDVNAAWTDRLMIPAVSYPYYEALRDATNGSAALTFYLQSRAYRGRDRTPPGMQVTYATAGYFGVLGVRARLGRFFGPDEDVMGRGAQVAVLSHAYWERAFAGDTAVIGQTLEVGLRPFTIIGVAGEGFRGTDAQAMDVFLPLASFVGRRQRADREWWQTTATYGAKVIVRPGAGFDEGAFQARANTFLRRWEQADDPVYGDSLVAAQLGPIVEARGPAVMSRDQVFASRLGGVAVIVLLIALANVVNLLFARSVSRQREIAVRLALGISRWRLVRLVTTETVLLATVAGGVGLLVAAWGGQVLRSQLMPTVAWAESALDGRVVAFTMAVAVIAGIVAGAVPAIQATNPRFVALRDTTAGASKRHRAIQTTFVAAQAAFSVVLVVAGSLMVRSLQNVLAINVGVDTDRLVFANVSFEPGEAPADSVRGKVSLRLAQQLALDPRIEGVARAQSPPMQGYSYAGHYLDNDSSRSFGQNAGSQVAVSRDYFAVTGLQFVRGRGFSGDDATVAPDEIVVNTRMAQVYWPGLDPVGQCLRLGRATAPCHRVVGVVGESSRMNVIEEPTSQFYVPLGTRGNEGHYGVALLVRTRPGARTAVATSIRSLLKAEYPMGYPSVRMMTENLESHYQSWRTAARLFGAFSVLALVVALVGVYSAVSYAVGRRVKEFGVRMALGARARDVINQVVGEGLITVLAGVAAGVVAALMVGPLLASMLFGVAPRDVSALLFAACTMLLVAGAASALPAWRAARVDPVTALRSD